MIINTILMFLPNSQYLIHKAREQEAAWAENCNILNWENLDAVGTHDEALEDL